MDGNKRTPVLATILFYGFNGYRVYADDNDVLDLALDVADHRLSEVDDIAQRLKGFVEAPPEDLIE